MSKVAIITCYNKENLVEQMKESVFSRGGGGKLLECEIIALDNTKQRFYSAAEAYNYALNNLGDAEVLVFCHQDIIFLEGSIARIYELCIKNENTLFGAAGVKNSGHSDGNGRIISSMAMLQEGWNYYTLEKGETQEVFSLDECLIAGHRRLFSDLRFDENVCDGWHLYAAEMCMQCHKKKIPVIVFDANIIHLSGGTPDQSFYDCERKLVKKYRKDYKLISYSCGWAYTNPFKYQLLRIYRRVRYGVK